MPFLTIRRAPIRSFRNSNFAKQFSLLFINSIQDGPSRAAHWWRDKAPFHRICHIYPTMMKLGTLIPYLKNIQKIYKSHDTPLEFCWHQHFFPEISKFCYTKKYIYRFYFDTLFLILLTFFESWKIFLMNMVKILMMSAKMATLGLLIIKIFWNKRYDIFGDIFGENIHSEKNACKQ